MAGDEDPSDADPVERELEAAARGLDEALLHLRKAARSGLDAAAARAALDEAERQLRNARARMDRAEAAWRAAQGNGEEPQT